MTARTGLIKLIQQNDVHGQLDTHWELFWRSEGAEYRRAGGIGRAAAVVRRIAGECGAAILVDCGDALHGTLPVVRTRGSAMARALRAAGVGLLVPGNWDYGYGAEALVSLSTDLGCPVVAANAQRAEDGSSLFPPTHIEELGGVRVGFVGLTSPIIPNMSARFAAGLRFPDARRVLPGLVAGLRAEEGCDVVVLASHLGFPQDLALAREIDGIDVVLSGHTHNRLERPVVAGRCIIIQSGFSGSFLGRLDLEVGRGGISGWTHELIELDEAIVPDAAVEDVVRAEVAPFADEMAEPVGRTEVGLHRMGLLETTMDNLIVEAYRSLTGAEVGISRGWRFGPPVPPGPVTMGDLWTMIPTDPEVFTASMTGEQLLRLIEGNLQDVFAGDPFQQSGGYVVRTAGMSVVFRPTNGRGARVEHIEVGGSALDPDREYSVVAAGGHDVPASVARRMTGVTALDAIRRYFGSGRRIAPELTGRKFIAQ